MLIKNIRIPGNNNRLHEIGTRDGKITKDYSDDITLDLEGALAFPGLINSHDHLEFNLFPMLGNRTYEDFIDWGNDIHLKNKVIIERVKQVPYEVRFKWGLYKNLLNGFTTVAHHGNGVVFKYIGMPEPVDDYNYIHSVRLEKMWRLKLNLKLNNKPFVLHTGEGTNKLSYDEMTELNKWNITRRNIIGVHGISADRRSCKMFAALVWCPDSNLFLYNMTPRISELKKETTVLFGTDSTVSSHWNIWDQIRMARSLDYLSDIELYESLSKKAAAIWGLQKHGSISDNYKADIVFVNRTSDDEWNSFYDTDSKDILLILKGGRIVFIDEGFSEKNNLPGKAEFDIIEISGVRKYAVKGLKELADCIIKFLPEYEFPIKIF